MVRKTEKEKLLEQVEKELRQQLVASLINDIRGLRLDELVAINDYLGGEGLLMSYMSIKDIFACRDEYDPPTRAIRNARRAVLKECGIAL